MSRIGKSPIPVPSGVEVKIDGAVVSVKGKLGELSRTIAPSLKLELTDGVLTVNRPNDEPEQRSLHGLTRSLLANMVHGVQEGFEKRLELIGTGYRVNQKGDGLELSVGYSHTVSVEPLGSNKLGADGTTIAIVSGPDKESVGEQAAQIRRIRKPNPYTGKGIKYVDEVIRRKTGKSAVGTGF